MIAPAPHELSWGQIIQAGMRVGIIVVAAPILNDLPSFKPISEPFHGQAFIPELAVETFIGTVLPGLTRFDQYRFRFFVYRPLQQLCTDELRAIIAA